MLGAVLLLGLLGQPGRAPSLRPLGAGLPPGALAPAAMPPPALRADPPSQAAPPASLAANIAAEEQRLADLRSARVALEAQLAALRQEAEQRQRTPPALKDGAEAGQTQPPIAAAGGGRDRSEPIAASAADPARQGMRIFVHHRANSRPGAQAAAEVAENLRGAGLAVTDVRSAPFVPSTPVVRYFHQEDQDAAARLASRLGRGWAIQDFRAFEPQPPPHTLEVWLPGN